MTLSRCCRSSRSFQSLSGLKKSCRSHCLLVQLGKQRRIPEPQPAELVVSFKILAGGEAGHDI